jgi:putative membrane protein
MVDLSASATSGATYGVTSDAPQMWRDGDHMGWGGGWSWVMIVWMSLFWLVVVGLIAWGIVSFSRHEHRHDSGSNAAHNAALEIAKQRYAKGEINAEEFEKLKRDLS